jgi:hypothetical protein
MRDTVRAESTGWRDLSLSLRHREWGVDCPAADIDCLVEIARGVPVAIIEYKKANARVEDAIQSIRSIEILADRAKVAFFLVRYSIARKRWYFRIERANAIGTEMLRTDGYRIPAPFSEVEFVRFLYRIRRRDDRAVLELPVFIREPIL